jgi:hypothetical protein
MYHRIMTYLLSTTKRNSRIQSLELASSARYLLHLTLELEQLLVDLPSFLEKLIRLSWRDTVQQPDDDIVAVDQKFAVPSAYSVAIFVVDEGQLTGRPSC